MLLSRNRYIYFGLTIIVMILGLGSRQISLYLPDIVNLYLGDVLWGLMVFLLFGFILKHKETKCIAIFSILFSFTIEISQLYHSQWIDSLRQTTIGGLILGYGFLWTDLVSYCGGIGIGVFIEKFIIRMKV